MYEARNLSVAIDGRTIVRGVDLAIAPGRVVAVIGPNGAGKSTLLRTMGGERKSSGGSVHVHDIDVATLRPEALAGWRAVLGQSLALSAAFTVDEVVRLGVPTRTRNAVADALAGRALAAVRMEWAAQRPITHLSGGEQQRAHMARVLVQLWAAAGDGRPRYLFLDEPTAHLDPAHQHVIVTLAREHARQGGGVMAVLHDLSLAAAVADEIAVVHEGAIVARGSPEAVLTAELLEMVYGIGFHVARGPHSPWIVPDYAGIAIPEPKRGGEPIATSASGS